MRTTPLKRMADAILTADWHLRADTPICRTDDFTQAMFRKVEFIINLGRQHGCPILIAGDVGHKPRWPHWLESWFTTKAQLRYKELQEVQGIFAVAGQHDLPNHRITKIGNSGLGVLMSSDTIKLISGKDQYQYLTTFSGKVRAYLCGFSYGQKIECPEIKNDPTIALVHMMVIGDKKKLWPGQEPPPQARALLRKHKCFDLIVTGDNHQPFTAEYDGRLLVNPGSMMRMTADQIDHKPRVYLWYADTNTVEAVYLPIEQGVVDRSHIVNPQERDDRIDAFVSRLRHDYEVGFSFEKNLEEFFKKNKVRPGVKDKVMEAIE